MKPTKTKWENQELKTFFVALTKEQRVKIRTTLGLNPKGDDDVFIEDKADLARVREIVGLSEEPVRVVSEEEKPKRGRKAK